MVPIVYIGTSGFSYRDWVGPVYPEGTKQQDFLSFYAEKLPMVELNFSYYRMPEPAMLERMASRTPEHFQFIVKAHRSLTHDEPKGKKEDFQQYRQALTPLLEEGKLACVLAQFPFSFKYSRSNVAYLEHLREGLPDLSLAVEFRNVSWLSDEVREFLKGKELVFVGVDEPALKGLMPSVVWDTAPLAYIRLHGRNKNKWWQHDKPHERYDYYYEPQELQEWKDKIIGLARRVNFIFMAFNNHYQGKSFRNALEMYEILQELKEGNSIEFPT